MQSLKMTKIVVILLATIFVVSSFGMVQAGDTFKIPPKGDKQITIGVMDLISSIEIAATYNKWHRAAAEKRGWKVQVFDVNMKYDQAPVIMENLISMKVDAIVTHWVTPKYYEKQIKKAWKMGIPVIGIANGTMPDGIVAEYSLLQGVAGAISAEYLATKLKKGDEVVTFWNPGMLISKVTHSTAKGLLEGHGMKIRQEIGFTGSGDMREYAYNAVNNALVADVDKKIRGFWMYDGGPEAARACMDNKREDIIVVTRHDTAIIVEAMRKYPTLQATSAYSFADPLLHAGVYSLLDKIFTGEEVAMKQYHGYLPGLLTRDTLPPKGYVFDPNAPDYKGRKVE